MVKLKENLTEAEYRIKSGLAVDVEKEVENALFRSWEVKKAGCQAVLGKKQLL